MKRFALYIAFVVFAVVSIAAKTYGIDDVPNVHLQDSTRFVSNPDGILSQSAVDRIDAAMRNIRRTSSAEAVVVVVDDIEGGDIDGFATELFEKWGLGKSDKDNGLLILVAKDLRIAAIRPGYGLEGVLPDITCGRILREQMFPRFKSGDFDGGLIASSQTVEKILTDPDAVEEIMSRNADPDYNGGIKEEGPDIVQVWLVIAGILTLILLIVFVGKLQEVKKLSPREKYMKLDGLKPLYLALTVFGLGIPILASLPLVIMLRRWRNAPHKCRRCGSMMNKIDEVHDNEYLDGAQDLEERIGSVDYDVWRCPSCGETDIEQYVTKGTPYHQCEKCHAYTSRLARTRVLRRATTTREGEGVREYDCLNCGHVTPERFVLPVVATPIIISGGGGSGGGFGGGGFGGGSFGGGSTGGGGASGGW
ncbi:MAG: TPM domain-containing protein [Muribaculaceae bacterium]|nr:TPM domain-containing protein [Muribaculaceae bacterium]